MSSPDSAARGADQVALAFAHWSATFAWGGFDARLRQAALDELLDYIGDTVAGRAALGLPAWLGYLLVAAFVSSFVYLVLTMKPGGRDPWDDGAQV